MGDAARLVIAGDDARTDDWMGSDGDRLTAFFEGSFIWEDLRKLDPLARPAVAAAPPVRQPVWTSRRAFLAAGSAIAASVVAVVALPMLNPASATTYQTAVGEQRTVALADGSQIRLNTDTLIEVHYTAAQRGLRLVRGEALFEVAHDASKPFVVTAGDRSVRALGTSFVVRNDRDRVEVTLIAGRVEVSGEGMRRAVALVPGQRFRSGATPDAVELDKPKVETVIAWCNGQLIFDDTPLAEAVREAGRYEVKPILLDIQGEPSTVSGVFRTGESRNFARGIATMYGLEIDETPSRILVFGRVHNPK